MARALLKLRSDPQASETVTSTLSAARAGKIEFRVVRREKAAAVAAAEAAAAAEAEAAKEHARAAWLKKHTRHRPAPWPVNPEVLLHLTNRGFNHQVDIAPYLRNATCRSIDSLLRMEHFAYLNYPGHKAADVAFRACFAGEVPGGGCYQWAGDNQPDAYSVQKWLDCYRPDFAEWVRKRNERQAKAAKR